MANRPIFRAISQSPYFEVENVNFKFYSGFSVSQKQKSINDLHEQYIKLYPNANILEISSEKHISPRCVIECI